MGVTSRDSEALREAIGGNVDLFMVAGSGFREALPVLTTPTSIPMRRFAFIPAPSVSGHGGELIAGNVGGLRVLIATGRVHMYEGYKASEVSSLVRLVSTLGCRGVVLTNAAGSVDKAFLPGTLTLIQDHLNLTGQSSETGNTSGGISFTDMTDCYDTVWRRNLLAKIPLLESIYAGVIGPTYETTAEARMLATLGANTVGMSTVHECVAARAAGMRVLGLTLVTNMAGGLGGPISHGDVLKTAEELRPRIVAALEGAVESFALSYGTRA